MCGIAGLLSGGPHPDIDSTLVSLTQPLHRRGPDNLGSWFHPNKTVGLAHTRLSILDLTSSANQPFFSTQTGSVLVFNGEIYNHNYIRSLCSYNWKTSSDTETLLVALEQLGLESTLKAIVGMFAFAYWDSNTNNLILARDRFGEKPLYYRPLYDGIHAKLLFSSDLDSFLDLPCFPKPRINLISAQSYFSTGFIPQPYTIYDDTFQLPAGSYLICNSSTLITRNLTPVVWWSSVDCYLSASRESSSAPAFSDARDIASSLLSNSVRLQSYSDVPLGCFLSGGIDSSLVAYFLQSNSNTRINTYTVSFPDSGLKPTTFDESASAINTANFLGSDHTVIPLTPVDIVNRVNDLAQVYSELLRTPPSCQPIFLFLCS